MLNETNWNLVNIGKIDGLPQIRTKREFLKPVLGLLMELNPDLEEMEYSGKIKMNFELGGNFIDKYEGGWRTVTFIRVNQDA